MLIDTHCHLDFPDFAADLPGVIARAKAAGVGRMITISTKIEKTDTYRAIAEAHDCVWFTVGTHPLSALKEPEASLSDIIALSNHPRCVGLGEAGLDYHYDEAPRDIAARVFRTHIAAARQTGLPLVIHSRNADDDMAMILKEEMEKGAFKAVLHCFTATKALADAAIALGLYVSFSGVLTFKNSQELRDIARDLPIDRVLVETDAPYLAPMPHRGKTNEPSFVAHTAKVLGEVMGVSEAEIATITTANAHRLFSKLPELPQ